MSESSDTVLSSVFSGMGLRFLFLFLVFPIKNVGKKGIGFF